MKKKGVNVTSRGLQPFRPHIQKRRNWADWIPPVPKLTIRSQRVAPSFKMDLDHSTVTLSDGSKTTDHVGESGISFNTLNSFGGVTNPYWKDQVRQGVNATTAASGTRIDYEIGWVSAFADYINNLKTTRYTSEWYGYPSVTLPSGSAPSASLITSVNNRAISKFLDRADSAMSSVESGQDFGEIKESLDSMVRPLSGLRKHVLSYFGLLTKASRKKRNRNLPKVLADTYLEWTFGWKPLALDVAAGYAGLKNRNETFANVPIHSSATDTYNGQTLHSILGGDTFSLLNRTQDTKSYSSYSVRYKGVVRTGARNGSIPVSQVLQVDLPHFLPTAWDLLPYSFIADYFTNVGDIIRAYSFRSNSISWCCKTTRQKDHIDILTSIYPANPVGWFPQSTLPGASNSWVERVAFTRTPYNPSLLSRDMNFNFHIPTGKPWLNMAAIMASRALPLVPFFK